MKKRKSHGQNRSKRFLGMATSFAMALSILFDALPVSAMAASEGKSGEVSLDTKETAAFEEKEPVQSGETSADVKRVLAGEVDLTGGQTDKSEKVTKYVYDFMDLYLALGLDGNFDVKVMKDIEETWSERLPVSYVFEVHGEKSLDLNGHSIIMNDEYGGDWYYLSKHTLCKIFEDSSLTIYDSSNAKDLDDVQLFYDGYVYSDERHWNRRDLFDVYGTLIVNGGKLCAGRRKKVWIACGEDYYTGDYWGAGWGYAMIFGTVANVKSGGTFVMNGGVAEGCVEKSHGTPNNEIVPFSESVIYVENGGKALINGGRLDGVGDGKLIIWENPADGMNSIAAGSFRTGEAFTERIWTILADVVKSRAATELGFDYSNFRQGSYVYLGDMNEESPDVLITPGIRTCTLTIPEGEQNISEQSEELYYEVDANNANVKVEGITSYFPEGLTGPGLNYDAKITWTLWNAKTRTFIDSIVTDFERREVNVAYDFPYYRPKEGDVCFVECKAEETLHTADAAICAVTKSNVIQVATKAPNYTDQQVSISSSFFPDKNFRNYLRQFDTNQNGILETTEIQHVKTLELTGRSDFQISSLEGLHYLWNVREIHAAGNHGLRSFDGTNLPYLTDLDLECCGIDSINLKDNQNLRSLNLQGINDYDFYGELSSLDLSGCPALSVLRLDRSLVNNLDVSNNPYLVDVVLYGTKKQVGTIHENDSYNTFNLQEDGKLCHLDYPLGNTLYVAHINDAVPDENLRRCFIAAADSNKDGLLTDCEAMDVYDFFCEESGVENLKGIELLPNLERLDAYDNEISSVDFSRNLKLKDISIYLNKLDGLDVSMLTELEQIAVGGNAGALRELDLHNNTKLTSVSASHSGLTSLSVSGLTELTYLAVDGNGLKSLNLSGCEKLASLYVANNQLWSLDVTRLSALKKLDLQNNNLSSLNLENNAKLEELYCYGNRNLIMIDVSNCDSVARAFKGNIRTERTDEVTGEAYYGYHLAGTTMDSLRVATYQYVDAGDMILYINEHPESCTAYEGKELKFTVNAVGNDITYKWFIKDLSRTDAGFMEVGCTEATFTVVADLEAYPEGLELYCEVKDKAGYRMDSKHATLTILQAPIKITSQPADYEGTIGSTARFSVGTELADDVSAYYQWQYLQESAWVNFTDESATEPVLEIALTEELAQCAVRCLIWDGKFFTVSSQEVYFVVTQQESKVSITKQPRSWYGEKYGVKAAFDVEAQGSELTYQWQYKKGNNDFVDWGLTTANTANFRVTLNETTEKYKIRCKITDKDGAVTYTNVVRMLLAENNPIKITLNPEDYFNAEIGKKATFEVVATGGNLHYQWQWDKGGSWQDYAGATADSAVFKISVNESTLKRKFRCEVTDDEGNWKYSTEARMYASGSGSEAPTLFEITKQPKDWYGEYGKKASFSVEAVGSGALTYQWQYKKSGNWINYGVTTADTPNFKVSMNEKNVKWPIRCLITDGNGDTRTTKEVWMKLKTEEPQPGPEPQPEPGPAEGPVITSQPADWVGMIGKKASFSVTATGKGLSYQWQYKKGTADWTNYAIATADTANFQVSMNEKNVKWTFRCVITDMDGKTAVTNEVHMYVKGQEPQPDPGQDGLVITSQPGDYTGRIGKKATFSVTATGEGLTYEWQVKKTGGWSAYALAGYDTPTFQVSIGDKTATWTYRCVIRDAAGHEVATNEVRIKVAE